MAQAEEALGTLVERRARGRDLTELASRYRDGPLDFIRDVLKGSPWNKQVEIASLVVQRPLVAVATANGCGKGWLGARLALWWMYARQGLVLVTSAVERQLVAGPGFMGEVARAWREAGDLPGDLHQHGLRVPGLKDAELLAFTSTSASRMTGHHAPRILAIIDEAQAADDFSWEGLLACAVGDEDRLLALGNPLHADGGFARCFEPGSAWAKVQVSALEHPNLSGAEPPIPGGPSAVGIERMAAQWGRGSPTFNSRALGQFPTDAVETLCRRAWVARANERWRTKPLFDPQRPTVIGLDMARLGGDSCALAVRQGDVLYEIVTWRGLDTQESLGRVLFELRRLGYPIRVPGVPFRAGPEPHWTVIMDEIGIGAGPFDQLRRVSGLSVIGFNAGARASSAGQGQFVNQRIEAAWLVRRLLEQGTIALPPDPKLTDELTTTKYRTEPVSGRLILQPKDEVRAALGRSPDAFDAVCMAFALDLTDAWLLDLHRAVNDGRHAYW